MTGVCEMRKLGNSITAKDDPPNEPDNPNQWFRFFTSLFVHAGRNIYTAVAQIIESRTTPDINREEREKERDREGERETARQQKATSSETREAERQN